MDRPLLKPSIRRWGGAGLAAAWLLSASAFLLPAPAASIYRWLSPDGTVSFGDHPPANARKLQSLPSAPPTPPSIPSPVPQNEASSPPPAAATDKTLTAIERLNLLTALNNYQNSLHPPPEPRQHAYLPAYIGPGPFPPYGYRRPPPWRRPPPRPSHPPVTRPPTVLLPPPAPASMYSSPVLLP
ncbi:DUF4124 domain-containing protein [Acidithiobacillus sp. M4-SHS-6]|uniref:DUF4124 domain-containing protein n=1 Tax=Acidithiobacillus sp. M4-SHS-6 TaxID=3383024 RepID=UPI0039BE43EC